MTGLSGLASSFLAEPSRITGAHVQPSNSKKPFSRRATLTWFFFCLLPRLCQDNRPGGRSPRANRPIPPVRIPPFGIPAVRARLLHAPQASTDRFSAADIPEDIGGPEPAGVPLAVVEEAGAVPVAERVASDAHSCAAELLVRDQEMDRGAALSPPSIRRWLLSANRVASFARACVPLIGVGHGAHSTGTRRVWLRGRR